jgi:hypothetical protein
LEVKEAIDRMWFQAPEPYSTNAEASGSPEAGSEGLLPPVVRATKLTWRPRLSFTVGPRWPRPWLLVKQKPIRDREGRQSSSFCCVLDTKLYPAQGPRVISLLELLESVPWARIKGIPTHPQLRPARTRSPEATGSALGMPPF